MTAARSFAEAVARFGAAAKPKLSGQGASGAPEDQLRAPFEGLLRDAAEALGFRAGEIVAVGEASLADLQTRPDYAVTRHRALVGFVELKAPGKGADPRRFQDRHDRAQWEKLKALPNLVYTDGNAFSLWRSGTLQGEVVRLEGSVESAGARLAAPPGLERLLFSDFLRWEPVPPRSAAQLAEVSAGLCRLLRDEVAEQLARGATAFTELAEDWRRLLFPHASDEEFADGYAQAVTFGLLMARAQGIPLAGGLDQVARALARTNTLIGSAFAPADGRGDQPGGAQNLARHADAGPGRGGVVGPGQARPGGVALLLRGLPQRLRQRAAEADGLILHAARGRDRDGAAGR